MVLQMAWGYGHRTLSLFRVQLLNELVRVFVRVCNLGSAVLCRAPLSHSTSHQKNKEEKKERKHKYHISHFFITRHLSHGQIFHINFSCFFLGFFFLIFGLVFLSNRVLWLLSITGQVCHGIPRPNQRRKSLSYVVFRLSSEPSLTVPPFTLNPIRLFQSLDFVHTTPTSHLSILSSKWKTKHKSHRRPTQTRQSNRFRRKNRGNKRTHIHEL